MLISVSHDTIVSNMHEEWTRHCYVNFQHLTHPLFYDIPWHSILTRQNVLPSSAMFFHLLSRSLLEYISPHTCTYSVLLICAIHASYLPCLESLASRPNLPSPLVHLVTPELTKLLIISTSLCPTLKGSLLLYLNCLWHSHNMDLAQSFSNRIINLLLLSL